MTEKEKDEAIKKIIQELCDEQLLEPDHIQSFLDRFQEIYGSGDYRHKYSEILATIMEGSQNSDDMILALEERQSILTQNLRSLIKKAHTEKKGFLKKLEELYEFCNIEFQRLVAVYHLQSKTKELQGQTEELQRQAKDNQEQAIEQLRKELKESQTQYITMLGIFATMLAAFVSAMAVSSNVLIALKEASPQRLIFIACFVGLVFTNLLAGLFYFLNKITDKDTQCFSICIKSYKNPIVFLNIVLIAIVLFTICLYAYGIEVALFVGGCVIGGVIVYNIEKIKKFFLKQFVTPRDGD